MCCCWQDASDVPGSRNSWHDHTSRQPLLLQSYVHKSHLTRQDLTNTRELSEKQDETISLHCIATGVTERPGELPGRPRLENVSGSIDCQSQSRDLDTASAFQLLDRHACSTHAAWWGGRQDMLQLWRMPPSAPPGCLPGYSAQDEMPPSPDKGLSRNIVDHPRLAADANVDNDCDSSQVYTYRRSFTPT